MITEAPTKQHYQSIIFINILFTLGLVSLCFSYFSLWTLAIAAFSFIYMLISMDNNLVRYWCLWPIAPFKLEEISMYQKERMRRHTALRTDFLEAQIYDLKADQKMTRGYLEEKSTKLAVQNKELEELKQEVTYYEMMSDSLKRNCSAKDRDIEQLNGRILSYIRNSKKTAWIDGKNTGFLKRQRIALQNISDLIASYEENMDEIVRNVNYGLDDSLKILHAEDDPSQAGTVQGLLDGNKDEIGSYKYSHKLNGIDALEFFQHNQDAIDIIISDQEMGGDALNGETFVREVRKINSDIPIIIFSATEADKLRRLFEGCDVTHYVPKHRFREFVECISTYRTSCSVI